MIRTKTIASTLPELLVTMIVGGILLIIIFDGVDMIRKSVGTESLMDFGSNLERLLEYEMFEERSDSVVTSDSVQLFYRNGEVIKTTGRYDKSQ